MPAETDDAVRTLLDRAAIGDVIQRYARALDRRDWDAVSACFAPGAYADYGMFKGDIEEVVAAIRKGVEVFDKTMHFMEPHVVELAGDTARAETYAVAYHRRTDGDERKELVVRLKYTDELVRDGEAWLIKRRIAEFPLGREHERVLPQSS